MESKLRAAQAARVRLGQRHAGRRGAARRRVAALGDRLGGHAARRRPLDGRRGPDWRLPAAGGARRSGLLLALLQGDFEKARQPPFPHCRDCARAGGPPARHCGASAAARSHHRHCGRRGRRRLWRGPARPHGADAWHGGAGVCPLERQPVGDADWLVQAYRSKAPVERSAAAFHQNARQKAGWRRDPTAMVVAMRAALPRPRLQGAEWQVQGHAAPGSTAAEMWVDATVGL